MSRDKDLPNDSGGGVEEGSKKKVIIQSDLGPSPDKPDEKTGFSDKGLELLGESEVRRGDGFHSKTSKPGYSSSQELSLNYLCNDGMKDFPANNSPNSKGKEAVLESSCADERWVVRDFLQLNANKEGSSKRDMEDESGKERQVRDKKARMETLDLSLAPPDVSLSLNASKTVENGDSQPQLAVSPSQSLHSLGTLNNITQTTCSNDFTAPSLSYSYSHPFSHNPSCSLTRNSTENYEGSVGDQIWRGGEGTNGSVHSRFRPVGDGIALSGYGCGSSHALMNAGRSFKKESSNSLYKVASSDNNSSFPSELPARLNTRTLSGDSKGRSVDHFKAPGAFDYRYRLKFARVARIVAQCISESIPVMCQIFKEVPDENIELIKEYMRNLTTTPEEKDELITLQNQLERRSDLTKETLAKSQRLQLEILVAVKFGLGDLASGKSILPTAELVEIFLYLRCQNINCRSLLPVDDCECKICSTKKGFCSQCMCPVCLKFDSASNTCSWVGCDTCSHWCHAACGIEKNLIRPGPSSKGPSEMHFHCPGCGHTSEMLGFVKDVFVCCAKDWSAETLVKELDCVRKIFKASDDVKGKALYLKAQETIYRLERRVMSPSDACSLILNFFTPTGGRSSSFDLAKAPTDNTTGQPAAVKESVPLASTSLLCDMLPQVDTHHTVMKPLVLGDSRDFISGKSSKNNDSLDSLDSIVRIKEAESRMYQIRADEARKEAEGYCQLGRLKLEKLEEEYAEKLAKLRLEETEERRRKKVEELKILESAHCDYYNMKIRMQSEIAGLLERMEATKEQWV